MKKHHVFIEHHSKILITKPHYQDVFRGGVAEFISAVSVKAMIKGECEEKVVVPFIGLLPARPNYKKIDEAAEMFSEKYGLAIQNNLLSRNEIIKRNEK
jgi:hypothetical protein